MIDFYNTIISRFIENCDLIVYKYNEYGKQFAKENKLSIGKINKNQISTNKNLLYFRCNYSSCITSCLFSVSLIKHKKRL